MQLISVMPSFIVQVGSRYTYTQRLRELNWRPGFRLEVNNPVHKMVALLRVSLRRGLQLTSTSSLCSFRRWHFPTSWSQHLLVMAWGWGGGIQPIVMRSEVGGWVWLGQCSYPRGGGWEGGGGRGSEGSSPDPSRRCR